MVEWRLQLGAGIRPTPDEQQLSRYFRIRWRYNRKRI